MEYRKYWILWLVAFLLSVAVITFTVERLHPYTPVRSLTLLGETVSVPWEVPNFYYQKAPKGYMKTYSSDILDVEIITYEDPHGRDLMYYVISLFLHKEGQTRILAVMVLTNKGVHVASYIDESLLKSGTVSGDLTKSMKQPNVKRVIKLIERRQEV